MYVGRLSKEKGAEGFLNAWKHIQGFQLKIMGDGPLSDDLRSYVDNEKIANVEFLGFVSSKEYLRYMQGASFLVIPSVCYENFPCIVSEALACGIPILASNLGGMSEMRENVLKEYEAKYTPEENHKTLLTVYSRATQYCLTGKA